MDSTWQDQDLKALRSEMERRFLEYPAGMCGIPHYVAGTGFFPVCAGVYGEGRISEKSVMIIGHDFGTLNQYKDEILPRRYETDDGPTWRELLKLLREVNLDPRECFFTNALMGLRDGGAIEGRSPAFRDKSFVSRCADFLGFQIELVSPRLIATLGTHAPKVLALAAPGIRIGNALPSLCKLDKAGLQYVPQLKISGASSPVDYVALTHPCRRSGNVWRRQFASLQGHAAELEMLRMALA